MTEHPPLMFIPILHIHHFHQQISIWLGHTPPHLQLILLQLISTIKCMLKNLHQTYPEGCLENLSLSMILSFRVPQN